MVNTTRKGKNIEKKAEALLIADGYATYRPPHVRFAVRDMFGLFDIIAISSLKVRLIQIKSKKPGNDVFTPIMRFRCPDDVSKEVWVNIPRKGFRVFLVHNGVEEINSIM